MTVNQYKLTSPIHPARAQQLYSTPTYISQPLKVQRLSLDLNLAILLPLPLDSNVPLILHQRRYKRPKVVNVRLQARLLPVLHVLHILSTASYTTSASTTLRHLHGSQRRSSPLGLDPRVQLLHQSLQRGHVERVELVEAVPVDGHAHAAGARVDDEGALEQMVEPLADGDVEARVRVLEDDVLLGVEQVLGVERCAGARLREGVDVGPLGGRGAARGGVPFLAEGVAELEVGDLLEEGLGFFGGLPGVLGLEDVVLEVVFEEVQASSVVLRCQGASNLGLGR